MDEQYLERALGPYKAEIANIRYFLREKRTVSQWQDWLWRKMPKLTAVTVKVPPHAPRLGRWGAAESPDRAVLHTDLLTLLVQRGDIVRERSRHTTTYHAKPLDTAAKPTYAPVEPF